MQYRLDMEEWIFSCCRHVCVVRWWWWWLAWLTVESTWNNNVYKENWLPRHSLVTLSHTLALYIYIYWWNGKYGVNSVWSIVYTQTVWCKIDLPFLYAHRIYIGYNISWKHWLIDLENYCKYHYIDGPTVWHTLLSLTYYW